MRITVFVLFIYSFISGCSSYQSSSVSIQDTVGKGKVKTINRDGDILILNSITEINGNYYGKYKEAQILIDTTLERSFYLRNDQNNIKKPFRTWIHLSDKSIKEGLLYQVTDSSVVIIPHIDKTESGDYFVHSSIVKEEYFAKDINKISVRKDGKVGKAAGKGFLIGAITGFTIGYFAAGEGEWFSPAASGGIMSFIGGTIGAASGAISKASKFSYRIDRDVNKFLKNKVSLKEKTIIRN